MIVRFMDSSGVRGFRQTVDIPPDFVGALSTVLQLAEELPAELTPSDFEKQLELSEEWQVSKQRFLSSMREAQMYAFMERQGSTGATR